MIKFFRKIRQKMLSENKFSKYLIYALGEIILVVIGILIALWLNNLNFQQKQKAQEIYILKELKSDILKDKYDFELNIRGHQMMIRSIDNILDAISRTEVYHDSLDIQFALSMMRPISIVHDGTYKSLNSKGLNLISNDSLREKIINQYGHKYSSLKNWENEFNRKIYYDEMLKRFDQVVPFTINEDGKFMAGKMRPLDFKALKKDSNYKSIIRTMQNGAKNLLNGKYRESLKEIDELVTDIDSEIDKLN